MSKYEPNFDLEDESQNNNDRWLLTYSDMITLLLALFIILYSISAVDAKKFEQVSNNMNAALHNAKDATSQAEGGGNSNTPSDSLNTVTKELNAYVQSKHLGDQLEITQYGDHITISIKEAILFKPDKAELLPESRPLIDKVAGILKSAYSGLGHITISGNTADIGEDTLSAWSLSSDRAIAVLERFVKKGMSQDKFSIEGNSHFNPVAPNDSEKNMAKNRRVEITVTKGKENSKEKSK